MNYLNWTPPFTRPLYTPRPLYTRWRVRERGTPGTRLSNQSHCFLSSCKPGLALGAWRQIAKEEQNIKTASTPWPWQGISHFVYEWTFFFTHATWRKLAGLNLKKKHKTKQHTQIAFALWTLVILFVFDLICSPAELFLLQSRYLSKDQT